MLEKIRKQLLAINAKFYRQVAENFNDTRQNTEPGWEQIWPFLKLSTNPVTVLDYACGNGRFIKTLTGHLKQFAYTGIEKNRQLLEIAKKNYRQKGIIWEHSLNELKPGSGNYNLICSFALLHHIPGFKNRLQLLQELAQFLAVKGYLVISLWQFGKSAKFSRKIQPWSKAGLEQAAVEPGDFLLNWGTGEQFLRYCHNFSETEIASIISGLNLKLITRFNADGKNQLNAYLIFQRE